MTPDHEPLTKNWVRGFLKRQTHITPKPRRRLDLQRVEACSRTATAKFFNNTKELIKPEEYVLIASLVSGLCELHTPIRIMTCSVVVRYREGGFLINKNRPPPPDNAPLPACSCPNRAKALVPKDLWRVVT